MTEQERAHIERMVKHAEKVMREKQEQREKPPLTPQELAEAIKDLKKRYPNEFTK